MFMVCCVFLGCGLRFVAVVCYELLFIDVCCLLFVVDGCRCSLLFLLIVCLFVVCCLLFVVVVVRSCLLLFVVCCCC